MSEGKEALGLTEHHQNQIRELLRYNRFKRSERLVGIELCFKDFIETRLYDDETYTQDEVSKMLFSKINVILCPQLTRYRRNQCRKEADPTYNDSDIE